MSEAPDPNPIPTYLELARAFMQHGEDRGLLKGGLEARATESIFLIGILSAAAHLRDHLDGPTTAEEFTQLVNAQLAEVRARIQELSGTNG